VTFKIVKTRTRRIGMSEQTRETITRYRNEEAFALFRSALDTALIPYSEGAKHVPCENPKHEDGHPAGYFRIEHAHLREHDRYAFIVIQAAENGYNVQLVGGRSLDEPEQYQRYDVSFKQFNNFTSDWVNNIAFANLVTGLDDPS
jgi:hypothetical protein